MLTRTQLLILAAMVTLGGCFGGGLAVGIIAGDFDFALISLGLIIVLFGSVFVFYKPKKSGWVPLEFVESRGETRRGKIRYAADGLDFDTKQEFEDYQLRKKELHDEQIDIWTETDKIHARRAGDIHVGGEVLQEFK